MHCAHSVLLSENEMDLYVKHKPSVCHCAYQQLSHRPAPLLQMWRRGIDVGLGTDGAASWGLARHLPGGAHGAGRQQAVNGTGLCLPQ
jgi:Cytosine deaminase and related metal-dependent hydrolases